jgi:hypothetical protein
MKETWKQKIEKSKIGQISVLNDMNTVENSLDE